MNATRQLLWTFLVLVSGLFCMSLRALVDKPTGGTFEELAPLQTRYTLSVLSHA